MENASIKEDAVFRRPFGRGAVGDRLREDNVADIFKRVAAWIGISTKQVG
jgi:hypothetical protein